MQAQTRRVVKEMPDRKTLKKLVSRWDVSPPVDTIKELQPKLTYLGPGNCGEQTGFQSVITGTW